MKKFSFFGKRYSLNVAKFKSFVLDATAFIVGELMLLWMACKCIDGLFTGGLF